MRARLYLAAGMLPLLAAFSVTNALAAEAGFSVYGLGSAAFAAGITPPPGTYVTLLAGYYTGSIGVEATIGGETIEAGATAGFFQTGVNLLYVPPTKVLGGTLGVSLTVPVGHIDLAATIGSIGAETAGWGLGDISPRVQLGWQSGTFFNTLYVAGVIPTGRYQPGFYPSTGLNRPAIDTGWGFTWIDPATKIQINTNAGFTFNFINGATDYQSGTEFHFEWAIGREVAEGLTLGVAGYDYRQITGDSGTGATLGPFKGSVDAVGLALEYSSKIHERPVSMNLRHYWEFGAINRFQGGITLGTITLVY